MMCRLIRNSISGGKEVTNEAVLAVNDDVRGLGSW